jgi:hypothetical protein
MNPPAPIERANRSEKESGDKKSKSTSRNWDGELILAAEISTLGLSRKTSTGETRAHNSGGRETRQAGKARELITKGRNLTEKSRPAVPERVQETKHSPGRQARELETEIWICEQERKEIDEKPNCSGANEELENREVKHREPAEKTRRSNQKSQTDRLGTLHSMKMTTKIETRCYTARRNVLLVRTENFSPENQHYQKKKETSRRNSPSRPARAMERSRLNQTQTKKWPDLDIMQKGKSIAHTSSKKIFSMKIN